MADATKAASACGQTLAEGAARRGRVAAGNAAACRGRVAAGNAAEHRGRVAAGNAAAHRGRTAAGNAAARHVRLPLPGPSALARTHSRPKPGGGSGRPVSRRTHPGHRTKPRALRAGTHSWPTPGGGSGRPVSRRTHPATEPSPGPSALARTHSRPKPGGEADALFSGERIRPQNRVPGPVQCRPCGRRVRRDMAKTSEILHTKLAVTMIQYREESVLHQEERTR